MRTFIALKSCVKSYADPFSIFLLSAYDSNFFFKSLEKSASLKPHFSRQHHDITSDQRPKERWRDASRKIRRARHHDGSADNTLVCRSVRERKRERHKLHYIVCIVSIYIRDALGNKKTAQALSTTRVVEYLCDISLCDI